MDSLTISLLLGATLGVLYGVLSYANYRYALGLPQARFLLWAFGGMTVRMMVTLIAITLVITLTGVELFPFLGSFFVLFVGGLIWEVRQLHRHPPNQVD